MSEFFEVTGESGSGSVTIVMTGIYATRAEVEQWVAGCVNSGGGFELTDGCDQTLVLRVHRSGGVVEYDLMPRLRLRVPGFTEFGFDEDHEVVGLAADGSVDEYEEDDDPDTLRYLAGEALTEHPGEIGVRLDWPDVAPLVNPLPVGTMVEVGARVLEYGENEEAW